jgi:hypothetical protein
MVTQKQQSRCWKKTKTETLQNVSANVTPRQPTSDFLHFAISAPTVCDKEYLNYIRCSSFCGWEDNINMDILEVEQGDMEWIDLAQNRDRRALVKAVINLQVP